MRPCLLFGSDTYEHMHLVLWRRTQPSSERIHCNPLYLSRLLSRETPTTRMTNQR